MAGQSEAYEAFFKEADVNGDGMLTFDELHSVLKKHGYNGPEAEIKAFFEAVDFTGDRKITLDEYMLAMGKIPTDYHKSALLRQLFTEFDKDGSGEIDKSELKAIFKEVGDVLSEEDANKIMQKADADGSGTINYEEFVKAIFS